MDIEVLDRIALLEEKIEEMKFKSILDGLSKPKQIDENIKNVILFANERLRKY